MSAAGAASSESYAATAAVDGVASVILKQGAGCVSLSFSMYPFLLPYSALYTWSAALPPFDFDLSFALYFISEEKVVRIMLSEREEEETVRKGEEKRERRGRQIQKKKNRKQRRVCRY